MEVIFKHTWIMFIVVTIVNYFILKYRVQEHIDKNPDLKTGYDKILKAILIYGTIPWIIMAIGDLAGQTSNTFAYFRPRTFNPFVLTFHVYLILIWILSIRWVYFKNGADFLVQHPGFIRIQGFGGVVTPTSKSIKIFFALALFGGIAGMTMMWFIDFPAMPIK